MIIKTRLDNRKVVTAKMRRPMLKVNPNKLNLDLLNLNSIEMESHIMKLLESMRQRNKVTAN